MGDEVGTRAMNNRELSTHLSELRIEGSSITTVEFSEPCAVCGNKKRRCRLPPTSYRKKVLVVEDDGGSGESVDDVDSFTTSTPSPPAAAANCYCRCGSRTGCTATPSPASSVSLSPSSPDRKFYETPIEGSFLARLNALGSPVSSGTGKGRSSGGGGGGRGESGSAAAEKKRVDSGCSPAVDGNGKSMHNIPEEKSSEKKKARECSSADKVKVTVSCKCGIRHEIVF